MLVQPGKHALCTNLKTLLRYCISYTCLPPCYGRLPGYLCLCTDACRLLDHAELCTLHGQCANLLYSPKGSLGMLAGVDYHAHGGTGTLPSKKRRILSVAIIRHVILQALACIRCMQPFCSGCSQHLPGLGWASFFQDASEGTAAA